jgi:hypothetical protein
MESGKVVSNCTAYNQLRESESILETTNNMLVAAEYLECSLSSKLNKKNNSSDILANALDIVRIRQLPLSLAQQVGRHDVLKSKFVFDGEHSLKYDKGHHNVVISIKGSLSQNKYLLWVTDEILNATYRAYYPAVLVVNGSDYIVKPYYASGF